MSTQTTVTNSAPQDWHKADIKAALEKAGWSLRQLSLHHKYSPWALQRALFRPWPKAERLLAEAIGMKPEQLWPSRYNANGTSNRRRGPPIGTTFGRRRKRTTGAGQRANTDKNGAT